MKNKQVYYKLEHNDKKVKAVILSESSQGVLIRLQEGDGCYEVGTKLLVNKWELEERVD